MQIFLSKEDFKVATVNLNPKQLDLSIEHYYNVCKSDLCLNVYLITSELDFKEMYNVTKIIMSRRKTVRFFLFTNVEDSSPTLKTKCENPNINFIPLKKGLSIFVKCYENPILYEWHSMNDKIFIYKKAIWKTTGLNLKSKRLILSDERFINKKILRAATMMVNIFK